MKKGICILPALVFALLLAACGGGASPGGPAEGPGTGLEGDHILTARIAGVWEDQVLLAGLKAPYTGVYAAEPGALAASGVSAGELKAGEMIELSFDGSIEETQPAKLGTIEKAVIPDDGFDGLSGMYLDTLDLLWDKDPALHEGIVQIGFDLASTRLTGSEQEALALTFARDHGNLPAAFGTLQELMDRGLIDGENLVWEDGVLLSLKEKESGEGKVLFDAQMWRSGLGAYYLCDCTSRRGPGGDWAPCSVGGEAIS